MVKLIIILDGFLDYENDINIQNDINIKSQQQI
jgi:hypothetical protein